MKGRGTTLGFFSLLVALCRSPPILKNPCWHLTCAIRQFNLFCWGWCSCGAKPHTWDISRTSATLTWNMEVSRWFGKSDLKAKYLFMFWLRGLCVVPDLVASSNAGLADCQGNRAKPGISVLDSWVCPQADYSHRSVWLEICKAGFHRT